MTIHELKCHPPYCAQIARGEKTLEIRKDDRGFAVGDMLYLREWIPLDVRGTKLGETGWTGRHVAARVTHIVRAEEFPDGLKPSYVAMSLELYRTWVDGQAGPGDWSQDAPAFKADGVPRNAKRTRLAVLRAARDGELTYTPSVRTWAIAGRTVDWATIDLNPGVPDRLVADGLLATEHDGWDHYRGVLTDAGKAKLAELEQQESAP